MWWTSRRRYAAEQTAQVLRVLSEIGAEATPQILVLNKSDRLPEADRMQDLPAVTHRLLGETARLNNSEAALVSAHTGDGISELLQVIDTKLLQDPVVRQRFRVPLATGGSPPIARTRRDCIEAPGRRVLGSGRRRTFIPTK